MNAFPNEQNTADYFIAIYTHACKDYCDKQFFQRVYELSKGNPVHVVDNTSRYVKVPSIGKKDKYVEIDTNIYLEKLKTICAYDNFNLYHIDVPRQPTGTLFHRNVEQSVNYLRDLFFKTEFRKFLIMESDVLAPIDLLECFNKRIETLPTDWGMLGALYYNGFGFHERQLKGLQRKPHVLSGCTVYRRELIEKYPFRWDMKDIGNFPDALISFDSNKEFSLWDDHDIICEHLHTSHGFRQSKPL